MKKKLLGTMIGAMGLMLVACASEDKTVEVPQASTQEVENIVMNVTDAPADENTVADEVDDNVVADVETDMADDEIYESPFGANPWIDSDYAGVLAATGFDLVAPEGASNIAYSYMPSEGMAQLNYTLNNNMWVQRAQSTDELMDISGMYYEWDFVEATKVGGMDAMEYSYATPSESGFIDDVQYTRVVNWYDAQNKVTYSVSAIGNLDGLDTIVYIENLFNL